jgi:hypothetical protein
VVGIPRAILPILREHLSIFFKDEPGALVFPGVTGGPLRRGNFNKMSAWPNQRETGSFRSLTATGRQSAICGTTWEPKNTNGSSTD